MATQDFVCKERWSIEELAQFLAACHSCTRWKIFQSERFSSNKQHRSLWNLIITSEEVFSSDKHELDSLTFRKTVRTAPDLWNSFLPVCGWKSTRYTVVNKINRLFIKILRRSSDSALFWKSKCVFSVITAVFYLSNWHNWPVKICMYTVTLWGLQYLTRA